MSESNDNARQATLGNYISYGIYRGFERLLKPIPMELVCVIGGGIGTLGSYLLPSRRKMVIRNLRIAYGEQLSRNEIHSLCRKVFWRSGANFLSAIRANTMKPDDLHKRMEIVGTENLEAARTPDTGFILLLAHMGSWEILVQMHLIVEGLLPFGGLYRPLGNPLLDKLVKRRRQKTGTKLFSRADGFFTPIAHLKEGGTLGAFSDQNAGSSGMSVPFFGKRASMTNLPSLLHRRTGAPIIPVSMETVSHGRWRVVVHPAIEISDDEKTNAALTTSLCAQAFERMMSISPADVLWMHGYWKVGTKRPLKIDGVLKKKNASRLAPATKPFKVLVFTGTESEESDEILEQIHRLKNYRDDIEITVAGESIVSPDAVHHITMDPSEPPHIVAHKILNYNREMTTPLDCAIDFTQDASGENILKLSEVKPVFAMSGAHYSRSTAITFKDPEKRNLAGFLESLGINAEAD
ncbi:hypothetical protein NT6N_35090 [Oceaniferula spumae]|uniref:Lipid A biosynthesis acyltransferase n=1 Tax=Oceaniferula spumae TaxID=2979115 RepID=A0AAT9FR39_9BACT